MGLAVIRCIRRCYADYFKDFRRYNKLFNSVRIEADASETSLDFNDSVGLTFTSVRFFLQILTIIAVLGKLFTNTAKSINLFS